MKEKQPQPGDEISIGNHDYKKGFGPSKEKTPWDQTPKGRRLHGELKKEKKERIDEDLKGLVHGPVDAFLILTGDTRKNAATGEYVMNSFGVGDENSKRALGVALPAGGNDRVLAVAEMHRVFPEALVVPMTKSRKEGEPTFASIIEKKLLRLGANKDKMLLEENSIDTITEYKEAAKFWKERGWKSIVCILAKWHVPRAIALFNHIEDFADNDEEAKLLSEFASAIRSGELTVQFLDTTNVLSTKSSKYAWFFNKILSNDPGMRARNAAERRAVKQIDAGTYGNRKLTHKIWADQP